MAQPPLYERQWATYLTTRLKMLKSATRQHVLTAAGIVMDSQRPPTLIGSSPACLARLQDLLGQHGIACHYIPLDNILEEAIDR